MSAKLISAVTAVAILMIMASFLIYIQTSLPPLDLQPLLPYPSPTSTSTSNVNTNANLNTNTVPLKPVAAALAVRSHVASTMNVEERTIVIRSAVERQWPDACLGLATKEELCAEVITPGFEVTIQISAQVKVYRTNSDGTVIRLAMQSAIAPIPDEGPQVPDTSMIRKSCTVNTDCGYGYQCLHYYGIAGPYSPKFSTCEIPCTGPTTQQCPPSTHCTTIYDGPGQVCDYDTM